MMTQYRWQCFTCQLNQRSVPKQRTPFLSCDKLVKISNCRHTCTCTVQYLHVHVHVPYMYFTCQQFQQILVHVFPTAHAAFMEVSIKN